MLCAYHFRLGIISPLGPMVYPNGFTHFQRRSPFIALCSTVLERWNHAHSETIFTNDLARFIGFIFATLEAGTQILSNPFLNRFPHLVTNLIFFILFRTFSVFCVICDILTSLFTLLDALIALTRYLPRRNNHLTPAEIAVPIPIDTTQIATSMITSCTTSRTVLNVSSDRHVPIHSISPMSASFLSATVHHPFSTFFSMLSIVFG